MDLGAFSISLPVADVERSAVFYEALGFVRIGGDVAENWLILRNGAAVIGVFSGHIQDPMLTFNPGWGADGAGLAQFSDIRAIQAQLRAAGHEVAGPTDPDGQGPASITLRDPDGHAILIDQHVPAPTA